MCFADSLQKFLKETYFRNGQHGHWDLVSGHRNVSDIFQTKFSVYKNDRKIFVACNFQLLEMYNEDTLHEDK
jgi:hypothetical protein